MKKFVHIMTERAVWMTLSKNIFFQVSQNWSKSVHHFVKRQNIKSRSQGITIHVMIEFCVGDSISVPSTKVTYLESLRLTWFGLKIIDFKSKLSVLTENTKRRTSVNFRICRMIFENVWSHNRNGHFRKIAKIIYRVSS